MQLTHTLVAHCDTVGNTIPVNPCEIIYRTGTCTIAAAVSFECVEEPHDVPGVPPHQRQAVTWEITTEVPDGIEPVVVDVTFIPWPARGFPATAATALGMHVEVDGIVLSIETISFG